LATDALLGQEHETPSPSKKPSPRTLPSPERCGMEGVGKNSRLKNGSAQLERAVSRPTLGAERCLGDGPMKFPRPEVSRAPAPRPGFPFPTTPRKRNPPERCRSAPPSLRYPTRNHHPNLIGQTTRPPPEVGGFPLVPRLLRPPKLRPPFFVLLRALF